MLLHHELENDLILSTGLAEVGGMCTWPYSASVNEDNGLPLAFTMTHGLGHRY